jgi:hypothetical protein
MTRLQHQFREEGGAVLAQVGVVIFVLMAFNVFVLDYGLMWIARGQAQNAADAGALAGAVARGYDDRVNPPGASGLAAQIAESVARSNIIWRHPGTPVVSFDCPPGVTGRCTKVAVHRDGSNGSAPLETLFGPIFNVDEQRIRATATAMTANGNASPCVRALAFADGWDENRSPDNQFNQFSEVTAPPPGTLLSPADAYTPPSVSFAGHTRVSVDYNYRIVWEIADPMSSPVTRQLAVPLHLPGGASFHDNMIQCSGNTVALGQTLRVNTNIHPSIPTELSNIFALDDGADYNYAESRIVNSCAPNCAPISPRLIAVVLYDPARFQLGRATNDWTRADVGCPTNHPCVTVSNIVGFFIHRIGPGGGYGPHGHFLRYPGATAPTAPTFVDDASWLVTTHLIR